MTAIAVDTRSVVRQQPALRPLAMAEARRFARHPLFLGGVALLTYSFVVSANDAEPDVISGHGFFPGLLIGVVSMLVAYRLTRSTRVAAEATDGTPTSMTTRTAALCLASLVPAAVALLWLVAELIAVKVHPPGAWKYGTFGPGDRFAILAGESVVASLGAPLLGVAVGRWLRFPGAGLVLAVGVVGWVAGAFAIVGHDVNSHAAALVRLSAPYTFFATVQQGSHSLESWTGSPWWYLIYMLCLSALAAVAALSYAAGAETRRLLLRVGAGLLVLAIVSCALAVTGGLDRAVVTGSDGSRTVCVSTPGHGCAVPAR